MAENLFFEKLFEVILSFFKQKPDPVPDSKKEPSPNPNIEPTPEPKPEPVPEKAKSEVIFSTDITEYRKSVVSKRTIEILGEAGAVSKNDQITITSTIRTPQEQAEAMYNNELNHKSPSYAAPGKQVLQIYNDNINKPKAEVIALMVKKIEELARKDQLVSRHCVPEDIYRNRNIIDVTPDLPNPRDFCITLAEYREVDKIITPYTAIAGTPYRSTKINFDPKEAAIHIEFMM